MSETDDNKAQTATANSGSVQRMVSLPLWLVEDALEELYELLGERDWWKDEPRCGYQKQWQQLRRTADELAVVVRQANDKLTHSPST